MHYSQKFSFARSALGARVNNQPDKKFEPKKYNKEQILAVLKELRSTGAFVGVIGKAAEVVRGLYDTCNVLQFYWGSDGVGTASYDSVCAALEKIGCDHFNSICANNSRAVICGKGIIFTFPAVEVFGRITEDDFDREGLVTPTMNRAFYRHMKFYDAEMEKQNHYESVVEFLREINGNGKDVLAIRALLEFADKKSHSTHDKFKEARDRTDHPEKYEELYGYIWNHLDKVLA